MKSNIIIIVSLALVCLFLLVPSMHAVEKTLIENQRVQRIDDFFKETCFSLKSVLKKLWGLMELVVGIGFSIVITQFFSLLLLPIILEIGLGPLVFLVCMLALLTIPFQIINGICLLIQKQFSLGKIKTFILTLFSFLIYIIGSFVSQAIIPFQ